MRGSGVDCLMGGAAFAARVCAALIRNSLPRQLGLQNFGLLVKNDQKVGVIQRQNQQKG
jgi:hypothetical protein